MKHRSQVVSSAFVLLLLLLLRVTVAAGASPAASASLTASLVRHDRMGLFTPGESIAITFRGSATAACTLTIRVVDEHDASLDSASTPITAGDFSYRYAAPGGKLGFYRVYASLEDASHHVLRKISAGHASRPDGYLTYAIVPDPAKRPKTIPAAHAFFGIQGGFNSSIGTDIFALLGARWNTDGGWKWKSLSPSVDRKFDGSNPPDATDSWATDGRGGHWTVYNMPNLTKDGRPYGGRPDVYQSGTFAYNTGALKPEFDGDFSTFCAAVARSWPKVYPDRKQPMYEVTWEPIRPWGYKGSAADLVHLYQLAHDAIKSVDAKAWVIGPCMHVNNPANLKLNYDVFDRGLGKYIDAYSAHPYMDTDIVTGTNPFRAPELAGQPALIHTMKRKLHEYLGRDIPMIGTEQGYRTRQDVRNEIDQARRLIRAQLMTLGEGWQMSIAFYLADYPTHDNVDHKRYWDWGLFYNLNTTVAGGYGPDRISPKPVAPAYAAMTYLLSDRHSVGYINWLGDSVRGYAYERFDDPSDVTLALWDFTRDPGKAREVTIDTGKSRVEVYDWMGNKTERRTDNGKLTVDLTKEPIYIHGVDPHRWGSTRPDRNVARGKAVTVSATIDDDHAGKLAVDGDSVSYLSRWCTPSDPKPAKWIAIDLGQPYPIDEVRFWTGQYQPGWGANDYQLPLKDYRIQRWDGGKWVNIVSRSGNSRAVVDEHFDAVTTSRLRLYVPAWSVKQAAVYEIEVMRSER